jgi:hypothetical protein
VSIHVIFNEKERKELTTQERLEILRSDDLLCETEVDQEMQGGDQTSVE